MKIRNGFVSNSSSSSFVILLPDNFNTEEYVKSRINTLESKYVKGEILEHFDIDTTNLNEDDLVVEKAIEIINQFIEDSSVYNYDTYIEYETVYQFLNEYIIAEVESGSGDSGEGILIDSKQIKKILEIKT